MLLPCLRAKLSPELRVGLKWGSRLELLVVDFELQTPALQVLRDPSLSTSKLKFEPYGIVV